MCYNHGYIRCGKKLYVKIRDKLDMVKIYVKIIDKLNVVNIYIKTMDQLYAVNNIC